MSHFVIKFLITTAFVLSSLLMNGQEIKRKSTAINPLDIGTIEKKQTDRLFYLLNSNQQDIAYKQSKKLIKILKTKESSTRLSIILSYYFDAKKNLDSMMFYAHQALKSADKITNDSIRTSLTSGSYNLLGLAHNHQGLLELSKKYHLKGIEIYHQQNKGSAYYTNLHGLANIYMQLGDYVNATKCFKQCLNYKEDNEVTIGSYINLGIISSYKKDYESSNNYFKKVKSICLETNNWQCQAISMQGVGANYEELGKMDEAKKYYEEAFQIAKKGNLPKIQTGLYQNIGQMLYNQKKYDEAELYFANALPIAIDYHFLNLEKEIYLKLQEIAVHKNDFKTAYTLTTKYSKISDSIAKMQNDKDINELDIKFKTLQKQNEINDLTLNNNNKILLLKNQEKAIENLNLQKTIAQEQNEKELLKLSEVNQKKASQISLLEKDKQIKESEILREKQIRQLLIIGFLLLLVPIIALAFVYYQKQKALLLVNKNQQIISEQKNKALLKEQELKLIKAEIEGQDKERIRISQQLHDNVGGNLAAIKLQLTNSSYGKENEIRRINNQINDTYVQIRNISHNLMPTVFKQHNFCEFIEEYQKKLADASNLKAYFSAHPRNKINEIDDSILHEVYYIIQELMTNTIKHANATHIELQLNLIESIFSIIFEDNGKGFNIETNKEGIGLTNINNRIKQLSGTLHIDTTQNRGSIFNLEIPIL